jgi:glycosyltransferase involved in cell wall biosynthesis
MNSTLAKKNVLIIGVTECRLDDPSSNTVKKFQSLSAHMNIFVLGRGKPFRKDKFGAHFYLIRSRLSFFPLAILVGAFLCLNKKIDTIVCQSPLTEGAAGVLLKYFFRRELIVEIHGDWRNGPFLNKKRLSAPLSRKVVSFMGSWALRNADGIRTLTNVAKHELQSVLPGKRYFTFPTFTDIDIFLEEKSINFYSYILTVAVLSPIKNTEVLIDAFSCIWPKFPEFKLVIAGSGPSLKNLQLKVKNKKLQAAVVFTGQLSLEGVRDVMKDCYAFVLPSLSEGLPRVLLEAMALSKPVIASNVGGIPEIVKDGENGFLIAPHDVRGLVKRLERLIESPALSKKMGQAGHGFVKENFSSKRYTENYISMIYS